MSCSARKDVEQAKKKIRQQAKQIKYFGQKLLVSALKEDEDGEYVTLLPNLN